MGIARASGWLLSAFVGVTAGLRVQAGLTERMNLAWAGRAGGAMSTADGPARAAQMGRPGRLAPQSPQPLAPPLERVAGTDDSSDVQAGFPELRLALAWTDL